MTELKPHDVTRRTMRMLCACGLLAAVMLAGTGCEEAVNKNGGTDPTPPTPNPGPSPTFKAQAEYWASPQGVHSMVSSVMSYGSLAATFVPPSASKLPAPDLSRANVGAAATICISFDPERIVDKDEDGLPAYFAVTWACDYPGSTITGTVLMRDQNDNDPNSLVEFSYRAFEASVSSPATGDVYTRIDGTALYSPNLLDFTIDLSLVWRVGSSRLESTYHDYSVSLTAGSYPTAGSLTIGGRISNSWNYDCDDFTAGNKECEAMVANLGSKGSMDVRINADLDFDVTCTSTFYTKGFAQITNSAGEVARMTMNGCGNWTTTYN